VERDGDGVVRVVRLRDEVGEGELELVGAQAARRQGPRASSSRETAAAPPPREAGSRPTST
jgi:hypothetical protein